MCCRFWRVLHPLLTLAAVACCAWLVWKDWRRWYPEHTNRTPESELRALHADDSLRTFLNVKSVRGTYRLPEGENYGVIALLWFENGKFRGRPEAWQITGSPEGTRVVSCEILWGKEANGKTKAVVVTREPTVTVSRAMREKTGEIFAKLDDVLSWESPPHEEVRGYGVLAHMGSSKLRPGGSMSFGLFPMSLKNRETVVVVGVKTFSTRKQTEAWLEQREPPDP